MGGNVGTARPKERRGCDIFKKVSVMTHRGPYPPLLKETKLLKIQHRPSSCSFRIPFRKVPCPGTRSTNVERDVRASLKIEIVAQKRTSIQKIFRFFLRTVLSHTDCVPSQAFHDDPGGMTGSVRLRLGSQRATLRLATRRIIGPWEKRFRCCVSWEGPSG